jgi:hypothetical protein
LEGFFMVKDFLNGESDVFEPSPLESPPILSIP